MEIEFVELGRWTLSLNSEDNKCLSASHVWLRLQRDGPYKIVFLSNRAQRACCWVCLIK